MYRPDKSFQDNTFQSEILQECVDYILTLKMVVSGMNIYYERTLISTLFSVFESLMSAISLLLLRGKESFFIPQKQGYNNPKQ